MTDKHIPYLPIEEDEKSENLKKEIDYYVVQHNDLIRGTRYIIRREDGKGPSSPTATERKLILYLVSKITPDMKKFNPITINIRHFYEIIGADADDGDQYNRFKKTAREMYELSIKIFDAAYPRGKDLRFLSSKAEDVRPGAIEFKLNDDLIPYLLNLEENYTQYAFNNILCMRSQYAIILYQLLKSYSYNRQGVIFSIDDLKANLDAANYENFTNFRKKVIEPAIRDINRYSDLDVKVDYEKTGRTFTRVKFAIKNLEKVKTLENVQELQKRRDAVMKKIDPDQITFTDIVGGAYT